MAYMCRSIVSRVTSELTDPEKSVHSKFNTEWWIMNVFKFHLIILCYGLVRTMTAPWMWKLYFWPCCFILLISIVIICGIVFFIAPLIPVFMAAMAMPPYLDADNAVALGRALKSKNPLGSEAQG